MGAAMADNLRLRVVLDLVDRVLSPLKRISAGGTETARALKAAKDQLKQLNAQQAAVTNVQTQAAEFQRLNNQLKQRQALLDGMRARGDATRTAMAREENAVAKLTAALKQQREAAGEARRKLNEMGVTGNLSAAQARLKTDIDGATAAMAKQRAELAKMGEQQRKLAELRKKHGSEMMHVGMMAAGSAALMAGGNKMAGPLRSVVGAFMPAENSETQLRASMMTNTGAVGPEFQQILDLATRLGDRLPGTTADFIDMMTMLRRQGMTSKAILGGLGESAAYLGIQLRMPVTAAAEFASKMQDATQTAEGDMMGLMDTIQRAYYLGVDPTNMLQGFKNMGAVMPYLGKKGLEASQQLAPLLVMGAHYDSALTEHEHSHGEAGGKGAGPTPDTHTPGADDNASGVAGLLELAHVLAANPPTQPVELVTRAMFNPNLSNSWFTAVTSIINNVTMLGILLTGAALLREREHGTIEHLLVMPVTPLEIMLSKIWSMGVVVLLASSFSLLVVVKGVLAVQVAGSGWLFGLATLLYLFSAASIGIFMATLANSMPQFGLMSILVLLPLQILSGSMTPRESMPDAIYWLMSLAPTTHYVSLAQSILFRDAGLATLWPSLMAVALIGALFFVLAHYRLRRTIGSMQG